MSDSTIDATGSRIVPTPSASDPRLGSTILDVVCGLDEDIEWHWTMTALGQFVSGYSIVRRIQHLIQSAQQAAEPSARRKTRFRKGAAIRARRRARL